ncbi:SDR family oxidoreductase [Deinococcus sp.]|uniref:SDR family oxidoreductase n=1 Tax=Deinococcus sp. TaxID=47478 RepID=UPI003C7D76C6
MNDAQRTNPTTDTGGGRRKVALVTGATNGIGKVTALELARAGYRVLLTSRDRAKGERVLEEMKAAGGGSAELYVGDLSSMADVRRVALEVRARHSTLDVLVNNAGGLFQERTTTVDGFETTFAFNHLAYFLLTQLLLAPLKAAAGLTGEARVVSVSSSANNLGRMRWDDLQYARGYAAVPVYSQSKLMNVLFAGALARRLSGSGVTSNSLHPGIVRSGFNFRPGGLMNVVFAISRLTAVSPEEGAQTSIYLATSTEVAGVTGQYFIKKRPARANPVAYDQAAQDRLWQVSEGHLAPWLSAEGS